MASMYDANYKTILCSADCLGTPLPAPSVMAFTTLVMILVALACQALAATYSISDEIVGSGFYNSFSFQAITDPTNGRV